MKRVAALAGLLGVRAVTVHLDALGLRYEVLSHAPTFRATQDAAATGVPLERELKTLVLDSARGLLLVALPASERLDVGKVRRLLDDGWTRLAAEEEIAREFPALEVGAFPPLGPGLPPLALLDERVAGCSRIVCPGGDHRHSLELITAEILEAARPRVADICEDGERPSLR